MIHPNELDQQIENLRTLQQSESVLADYINASMADAVAGKAAIAQAITDKGVATQPDATLADMAENIGDIQQVTTVIDGGDMYAAQMTGDGVLWNLYEVLAQMKSQYMGAGHYAALIVCEYYKGYDSLQLQGADAYYTCDGDFYDTSTPWHVWHDSDNGKSNRWVCFLFATEGARLDITNTAISPRSMYIGGHIGTIEYFVNGRLTELVSGVEETDVVDNFLTDGFTQAWERNLIIRRIGHTKIDAVQSTGCFVLDKFGEEQVLSGEIGFVHKAQYICVSGVKKIVLRGSNNLAFLGISYNYESYVIEVSMPDIEEVQGYQCACLSGYNAPIQRIYMPNLKSGNVFNITGESFDNLIDLTVGAMETNLDMRSWGAANIISDPDKKAQLVDNIKNHILARVSDATGGSQLVFSILTSLYNAIASETIIWNDQTMTLADAFLTKNWLLAGV